MANDDEEADNFMNLTTAIGIYATICKELGEGFIFPGSRDFYTRFDSFTSSRQHAKFCVWAALEPRAGGEAFNVVNGDVTSWQVLWPKLAKRFGVKVPRDQFEGEDEKVVSLSENPPLREYEAEMGLEKGRVKRGEVRMRVDLVAWAQRTEVREAWDRIVQRDGGQGDALVKATWFFLNFVLGRNYDVVISMAKARRFGFHDSVDSWDELSGCLDQLVADGVLPR